MTALYPAEKHASLRKESWSESNVRAGIRAIAEHSIATFDANALWPMHPLDGDDAPDTSFYLGAGGVFWGLSLLAREGAIDEPEGWFPDALEGLIARNEVETGPEASRSYLFGAVPLRMLLHHYRPSSALRERLFTHLQGSLQGPVSELMWGLAGCMLATLHLHRATGEARWIELYRAQADKLAAAAEPVAGVGYHFRPVLYGRPHDGFGAVHGFAGNVVALLAGTEHLSSTAKELLLTELPQTLVRVAVRDGAYVNWPVSPSSGPKFRVYHCHGAPGVVTSTATLPVGTSPTLDELLLAAGELIYAAGPVRKGPSLCHGAAGNGFAFLKLYERTGNELWLTRAREFAMHALWQVERARELFAQGRHSLWTGDIGVALFLNECLRGSARFPTIDVF